MPQKIQMCNNSKRDICIASKQYFSNEKLHAELLNTVSSYLEERCSGLCRSLRSVKREDSYMSKCSFRSPGKVLNHELPDHQISQELFKGSCFFSCTRLFIGVERVWLTEEVEKIQRKKGIYSFHGWLKSSTWKIHHYVYYFIPKIFAVLNTLLKQKQIQLRKESKEIEKPQITQLQKNYSMNHGWQKLLTGWGRGKNEQSATATSANTLRPVQPHP